MHTPHHITIARARGFSLVELMVSVTIGLLILAGMATLFSNNAKTQSEVEKANLQIENGRFTVQTIAGELVNAGFYGEFDPTVLSAPAAMPSLCENSLDSLREALPLHIQGVDNVTAANRPSCLDDHDLKLGTDVLLVRRVQTCVVGTGNCAAASTGGAFFQASLCSNNTQLDSVDVGDHYDLDTNINLLTRRQRNCDATANSGTLAVVRRFVTHIYFITNNSVGSDGIPTLKRLELGGSPLAFTLVPVVEGVENLQFEHGLDTDDNGTPDIYSANPSTASACAAAACAVTNWRNVVAVKMHVLARNLEPSPSVTINKTYSMGLNADNSANDYTPAATDKYRRHLFQSMTHLANPAGRKTP